MRVFRRSRCFLPPLLNLPNMFQERATMANAEALAKVEQMAAIKAELTAVQAEIGTLSDRIRDLKAHESTLQARFMTLEQVVRCPPRIHGLLSTAHP